MNRIKQLSTRLIECLNKGGCRTRLSNYSGYLYIIALRVTLCDPANTIR